MHHKVYNYNKCLLVAGFEATDALCAMEMGDGPSNSITTIENLSIVISRGMNSITAMLS